MAQGHDPRPGRPSDHAGKQGLDQQGGRQAARLFQQLGGDDVGVAGQGRDQIAHRHARMKPKPVCLRVFKSK